MAMVITPIRDSGDRQFYPEKQGKSIEKNAFLPVFGGFHGFRSRIGGRSRSCLGHFRENARFSSELRAGPGSRRPNFADTLRQKAA